MNLKQIYRKVFACSSCGNTSTHADGCQKMRRKKDLTRKTGIMAVLLVLIISSGSATTSIHLINDLGDGNQDDKYSPPVAGDTGSGTYYKISQEFCTSKTFYADRIQLYDFKYGDISSDEWALVDIYLSQGEADSQFAEGTKVKSGLNMSQSNSDYNIQFDSSYKLSSGNCYEFEMVTYDTNSDGDSLEDGIKGPYDNSSSTTKFYSNTAGSKNIYLKAEIFGEQKPVIESSSTSPSVWRYQDQPGFTANVSDLDIEADGLNGTFQGETLHHGTINKNEAGFAPGLYGSALNQTYDNDSQITYGTELTVNDGVTAIFRLKMTRDPDVDGNNNFRVILDQAGGFDTPHAVIEETRDWHPGVEVDGARKTVYGNKIPVGKWTTVAVTYSNSTGMLKAYNNGSLTGSKDVGSGALNDGDGGLTVGGTGVDGRSLPGLVDEFYYFNTALSESKIKSISRGNKFVRDELSLLWRLDSGSGGTAYDTHTRVSQYNNNSISGDAVSFDGNDDYIDIGNLGLTETASFVFEANSDFDGASFRPIFRSGEGLILVQESSDKISFKYGGFNQASFNIESGTCAGFTYNGTHKKFYENGDLEKTGKNSENIQESNYQISVGSTGFKGIIDNFHIYNKTLSGSQVSKVCDGTMVQDGLEAAYRFDNATNYYADSRGQNFLDYSIVPDVKLDVEEAGSLIKDQLHLSAGKNLWKWSKWTEYSISDAFTVDEVNVFYNATLTAEDQDKLTTSTKFEQYIKDSPPQIDLLTPENKTYYTYDLNYSWDTFKDGDDVLQETLDCTLDRDTEEIIQIDKTEGNGETGGGIDSGLGQHNTTLSCTEKQGAQQTSSETTWFTVDLMKIFTPTTDSDPVYETENTSYTVKVNPGSMVNNLTSTLYWDGRKLQDGTKDAGTGNVTLELFQEVPLVDSNNTAVDWRKQVTVAYDEFQASTSSEKSENTTQQTQNVWWNYHSPSISIAKGKVIEKEDFTANLSYVNVLGKDAAKVEGEITFNGSTKNGFSSSFDSPLVSSSSATKTADGNINVSFNGRSRQVTATSDDIDVYKKILTDCSNKVNGVTGDKALVFELHNEENQTQVLRGNIDYNFEITHHGEHVRNYAFENRNVTQATTCIYPAWAEYNITGPTTYESQKDQNSLGVKFPDRQYKINNDLLNNNTEKINLYLLKESLATTIFYEVVDGSGDPIPSATIKSMRYFVGKDSYLTVAKSVTDSDGVATTYLRVNEIYYKHIVTKNGEVLKATERSIISCSTTPCTITLQVGNKISKFFQVKQGFSYKIDKVKDSDGNVTGLQATVNHQSGSIDNATFHVERFGPVNPVQVCDITTSSTGQSMVCQFNQSLEGNTFTYTLKGAKDGQIYTLDTGQLGKPKGLFGKSNPWAAAFLFLVITGLGLRTPKTSIAFSTAGIVITWWMGLITVSIAGIASLVIIGLAVIMTGET